MKHIFTLLAVAAAALVLTSCEDKSKQKLDPNAMISLRPEQMPQGMVSKANPQHLSAIEIVKQCTDIAFWNVAIQPDFVLERFFEAPQRDTVNVRLMMWGTDIIAQSGALGLDFIGSTDLVFRKMTARYPDPTYDTIGYIPNKTMRDAESQIKQLYADQNYAAVYELFDRVFRFTPITGEEWRTLKEQGLN